MWRAKQLVMNLGLPTKQLNYIMNVPLNRKTITKIMNFTRSLPNTYLFIYLTMLSNFLHKLYSL